MLYWCGDLIAMSTEQLSYRNLDGVDRQIVSFLREDGRMSYREIARRLKVSEGMIRKRVQKLLDQHVLRIRAVGDPLELGVPVLAAILLTVKPGEAEEVSDKLAEVDNVRYVALGVGRQNIMVESLHASVSDLHAFINSTIGQFPSVISAETFQAVKIKKSVWDWSIPLSEDELVHPDNRKEVIN